MPVICNQVLFYISMITMVHEKACVVTYTFLHKLMWKQVILLIGWLSASFQDRCSRILKCQTFTSLVWKKWSNCVGP